MFIIKKITIGILLISLVVFGALLAHNAYAGKPIISLNSPVSFPEDI